MRALIQEGADPAALESAMAELRESRKKAEAELKTLREDLRELLDLREEAKLILHGVLD
jgi:cell division protein FtsB